MEYGMMYDNTESLVSMATENSVFLYSFEYFTRIVFLLFC